MYYLFLLMLISKKLISLSLASALVLSLPLNSLAIGVNDASNYVTSSDYNTKIAELETRIADLEANQTTTDVNTALQNYFTDDATSPIVAGDYITISNNNGKKMISASSKPTTLAAGDGHIDVTKNETETDITFTLKQKNNSFTYNFTGTASSYNIVYYTQKAVPANVTDAWVSGTGKFALDMLKNSGPLYSGATGTITGSYKVHFAQNFVSAEIYESDGLYAVAYTPTTDFRSVNNLAFNATRVTNPASGLAKITKTLTYTMNTGFMILWDGSYAASYGGLSVYNISLNIQTTQQLNPGFREIGKTNISEPSRLYGTAIYNSGSSYNIGAMQWNSGNLTFYNSVTLPANGYILISAALVTAT